MTESSAAIVVVVVSVAVAPSFTNIVYFYTGIVAVSNRQFSKYSTHS